MLVFGVRDIEYDDPWVYIEDALQSAIKDLECPFCGRSLVAKKATKEKPAHFSHYRSACNYVRLLRKLVHYFPITDYWLYGLSSREVRLFNRLRRKRKLLDEDKFISYHTETSTVLLYGKPHLIHGYENLGKSKDEVLEKLLNWKLIQIYNFGLGVDIFQLTWKAQMLWATDWSLKKLYQETVSEWQVWENRRYWDDWLIENLFSAMNRRLKQAYFYLLKITLNDKTLYKTGTTLLSCKKIIAWETQQLKRHSKQIAIEPVYFVDTIAIVESFIRIKYSKYIHPIGHQQNYFDFKNKAAIFLQDLHQVTLLSNQHKEKIKAGLKKAKNVGKRGKESITAFLAKPKSQMIIELLEDAEETHSLRAITRYTDCSINTVRKVKQLWEQQKSERHNN